MFFNINSRIKNQIKLFERGLKTDLENVLTICVEFRFSGLLSLVCLWKEVGDSHMTMGFVVQRT